MPGARSDSNTALALLEEKYSAEMPFHIAEAYAWRGESDLALNGSTAPTSRAISW